MHITLYNAISKDGFVADQNGSEDFIADESWERFKQLCQEKKALIIGRTTYELVKQWDKDDRWDSFDGLTIVVVGSTLPKGDTSLLAHSPEEALKLLEANGINQVVLGGGPTLTKSFLEANLIDEIILFVEPKKLNKGKSLGFDPRTDNRFTLMKSQTLSSSQSILRFIKD